MAKKNKSSVSVFMAEGDDPDEATARILTQPTIRAAGTIQHWNENLEVDSLAKQLREQVTKVNQGDMSQPEAMLMAQAHTLDELFNNLARRACNESGLQQYEAQLRLALRAQNQCRMTLETLSNIKNPPVVYAKQANFANNQQVNNGTAAHTAGNQKQKNELLEQTHGERLDTRTASPSINANQAMATLD
jgi:hypothetical protein